MRHIAGILDAVESAARIAIQPGVFEARFAPSSNGHQILGTFALWCDLPFKKNFPLASLRPGALRPSLDSGLAVQVGAPEVQERSGRRKESAAREERSVLGTQHESVGSQ